MTQFSLGVFIYLSTSIYNPILEAENVETIQTILRESLLGNAKASDSEHLSLIQLQSLGGGSLPIVLDHIGLSKAFLVVCGLKYLVKSIDGWELGRWINAKSFLLQRGLRFMSGSLLGLWRRELVHAKML